MNTQVPALLGFGIFAACLSTGGAVVVWVVNDGPRLAQAAVQPTSQPSSPQQLAGYIALEELAKMKAPEPGPNDLELVRWSQCMGGPNEITGIVRNNSSRRYSHVWVSFNLYDRAKHQVGNASDAIGDLEPRHAWEFHAPVLIDNYEDARLAELSGW